MLTDHIAEAILHYGDDDVPNTMYQEISSICTFGASL